MSLGSEYLSYYAFKIDHPFGLPDFVLAQNNTWTTRDGRKIKVRDMTDKHILNCMKIVGEDDPWFTVFKTELNRRAENEN